MTGAIDTRHFRDALGSFATGVTIVTTRTPEGEDIGLTASSFNSVSLDPPMILWSLAKSARSIDAFNSAEHFAVHILGADQEALSNRFAARGTDKFAGLDIERNAHAIPLLSGSAARFQCRTAYRYEGGDHVIIVGEVHDFDHLPKPPLVFHGGAYAEARAKVRVPSDEGGAPGSLSLGKLVTRAYMRLVSPVRRASEKAGLSAPERYAMNVLMAGSRDLEDINAIVRHLGVPISQSLMDDLDARGLVQPHPGEDGEKEYRLTDAGHRTMVELAMVGKAAEEDTLGLYSSEERAQLERLLSRLLPDGETGEDPSTRHLNMISAAVGEASGETTRTG